MLRTRDLSRARGLRRVQICAFSRRLCFTAPLPLHPTSSFFRFTLQDGLQCEHDCLLLFYDETAAAPVVASSCDEKAEHTAKHFAPLIFTLRLVSVYVRTSLTELCSGVIDRMLIIVLSMAVRFAMEGLSDLGEYATLPAADTACFG